MSLVSSPTAPLPLLLPSRLNTASSASPSLQQARVSTGASPALRGAPSQLHPPRHQVGDLLRQQERGRPRLPLRKGPARVGDAPGEALQVLLLVEPHAALDRLVVSSQSSAPPGAAAWTQPLSARPGGSAGARPPGSEPRRASRRQRRVGPTPRRAPRPPPPSRTARWGRPYRSLAARPPPSPGSATPPRTASAAPPCEAHPPPLSAAPGGAAEKVAGEDWQRPLCKMDEKNAAPLITAPPIAAARARLRTPAAGSAPSR